MTQAILQASVRDAAGKGTARQARRDGKVPAVIYGNNEQPLMINLDANKLSQSLAKGGFFTHILNVELNGKKHAVLARDAQMDPVSDICLHVDFLRVTDKTEIRIAVPVFVEGQEKSPGIKRGGVVNLVIHEVDLYCLAGSIPESITINASALDIGDSIHLADVTLPKGVRPINAEEEITLVTIAAPTALRDDARAAAEAKAAEANATAAPAAAAPAAGVKAAPGQAPAAKAPAGKAAPAAPAKKK